MAEPQSDILKRIHETERQADRIIREAESSAKTLREEARVKAEEILKTKERELSVRRPEMLSKELGILGKETETVLEKGRDEAEKLTRPLRSKTGPLVDRLLEKVLL